MTGHEDQLQVIAAFADGERVDAQELRTALADEAGREYLIELVAMREVVRDAEAEAVPGHAAAQSAGIFRNRTLMGLAAAVVMAVGLGGYAIGQQRSHVVTVAVHPPPDADVVIALEAPPAPTHVIPLDSGAKGGGR